MLACILSLTKFARSGNRGVNASLAHPQPHSAPTAGGRGAKAHAKATGRQQPRESRMIRMTAILLAAILAAPVAASAQTLDLPTRKAGLWEISMTVEKPKGMPAITTKACLDPATDRELMDHGLKLAGGKCKSLTSRRQGQSYVIDAECSFGGAASRTRTVIAGDFGSSYTVRTEGATEGGTGAEKGPHPTLMTQTATWKSADCPGMKPGDMTMPGGLKVNVKQLKALSGLIR
jgi:uncharacterized protein DUF3617